MPELAVVLRIDRRQAERRRDLTAVGIGLLGQYVTANFKLSTDEYGGTLIVDPPVSSGSPVVTPR